MGTLKGKHFVWVQQDEKAIANANALYAKACSKSTQDSFVQFHNLQELEAYVSKHGKPISQDKLTIIMHGTPNAQPGDEKFGMYTVSELSEAVFDTPNLDLKNVGKIVLLSCADSEGRAAAAFNDLARFADFKGTIVSYYREVSVGPDWARYACDLDAATDGNMVLIRDNREKYRVERKGWS